MATISTISPMEGESTAEEGWNEGGWGRANTQSGLLISPFGYRNMWDTLGWFWTRRVYPNVINVRRTMWRVTTNSIDIVTHRKRENGEGEREREKTTKESKRKKDYTRRLSARLTKSTRSTFLVESIINKRPPFKSVVYFQIPFIHCAFVSREHLTPTI